MSRFMSGGLALSELKTLSPMRFLLGHGIQTQMAVFLPLEFYLCVSWQSGNSQMPCKFARFASSKIEQVPRNFALFAL